MSAAFNVNDYWIKRGRNYVAESFPAEYHRLQERFLLNLLTTAGITFHRILELGCGFGRITRLLAECFPSASITALDLSIEQLDNARRHCDRMANIEFRQYDFYSGGPLPANGYDLGIAVEVFLHHPAPLVAALIRKLSRTCRYIVNIDWSEDWSGPRPEHVWLHDYGRLFREAGLQSVALPLPEKVDGLQQALFFASKELPGSIVELAARAASVSSSSSESPMVRWQIELQNAIADLREVLPANAILILVNDDQWGSIESDLRPCRILPFLERDGLYWGRPADDESALAELKRMQASGATHLALASHCFWWLDHYAEFARYLREGCRGLLANERIIIFQFPP